MLTIERMQTAPGFGKSTGAARAAGHRSKGAPRGHGRPGSGETEPNGRFRDEFFYFYIIFFDLSKIYVGKIFFANMSSCRRFVWR